MPINMKPYCVVVIITLCLFSGIAVAQKKSPVSFRLGATVSFGLNHIAQNDVGLGGLAAVEKRVTSHVAVEANLEYHYFTGDKTTYAEGKNKAFAIPALAGFKFYPVSNIYGALRTGAIYFLLNDLTAAKIRMAYGAAAGINLPKKTNRVNLQLGYTGFRYEGIGRGYTTLAAAIIIN